MTLYGEGSSASSTDNELWSSEGSGMLIGDPLGEGSNASSTDNELWRAENSFLIMLKRELHAHR